MLIYTQGDPYSINVELAHSWLNQKIQTIGKCLPIVLIGQAAHWRDQEGRLGLSPLVWRDIKQFAEVEQPGLHWLHLAAATEFVPAELMSQADRGRVAVAALAALHSAPKDRRLAVVTGPIDKYACHAAGFAFPGQTEFFEALWGSTAVMTLAGSRLRVGLVTNHLPLAAVATTLSAVLLEQKLRLFVQTLQSAFAIPKPRIAVCGLNPHASDQGLFGDEEARVIAPVIAHVAEATGLAIRGPLPADTVFYRALQGSYDGVLAMYHDQGLGPLKTVHFDDAINLSGGLPHLRVSPDHGPASDLFLRRQAQPASMHAAFDIACQYLLGMDLPE